MHHQQQCAVGRWAAACLILAGACVAQASAQTIYTPENAPSAPSLEELPMQQTISQHGITWTLAKPARVGRFVNGDYYVVGPVTVTQITPGWDGTANGSMLNPQPLTGNTGLDSRLHGFKAELQTPVPIEMKPGDSLVSSISCKELGECKTILWPFSPDAREARVRRWLRSLSVLTCMAEPQPPDAFRPSPLDRENVIFLARNLRRHLLRKLEPVEGTPRPAEFAKYFERCWLDLSRVNFHAPAEYAPQYGRETARCVGMASLILLCDFPDAEKEPLLVGFVQYGIDLYGTLRAGYPGWGTLGGHGQGRKWPLIFAGILLGDEAMAHPDKTFPDVIFQQDNQTVYGKGWTGATVLWAGHLGQSNWYKWPDEDRRAYFAEAVHPSQWPDDGKGTKFSNPGRTAEAYRRCCTSHAWIAQALSARIMHAEKIWNHDAFFDYCDRWMTEDDTEHVKVLEELQGMKISPSHRQRQTWDPWVDAMYHKYRNNLPPAIAE